MADIDYDTPGSTSATVTLDGGKSQRATVTVTADAESIVFDTPGSPVATATLESGKTQRVAVVTAVGPTSATTATNAKDVAITLTDKDGQNPVQTNVQDAVQTLKNDEGELGQQVHEIQAIIPESASTANQLVTNEDLPNGTGLEGDYCSKYGIADETKSGLPYQGNGNQVIIPAQLQLDMYGTPGLTTVSSKITVDLTPTTNCEVWLESGTGTVYQPTKTYWQETEPAESSEACEVWVSSAGIQVKSNDTGNVFRKTNITRVVKCIFTDGNLTRLCFTGCRVQNKQEYAPKDSVVQNIPFASTKAPQVGYNAGGAAAYLAPLGFGYSEADAVITPASGTTIDLATQNNRQFPFAAVKDGVIDSIFATSGTWGATTIPTGVSVKPFLAAYSADAASNLFTRIALVESTDAWAGSVAANAMIAFSAEDLNIPVTKGQRLMIVGGITATNATAANRLYIYFTGSVGIK